ncbi:hypothetical protein AB0L65_33210 [Nonomuraea sp. NPDC052116]|uniref:hypothetical protein n=1 Tax=Nonomuraea sp. NPDC052116 TaxID=3155665 RepID=UPI003430F3DF
MQCWRGPEGIIVEVIVLDTAPLYRVSKVVNDTKYFVAYCANTERLAEHVDLADLCEVIDFPAPYAAP